MSAIRPACSDKECHRVAEFLPKLVGWPGAMRRSQWRTDNAIELVLDLPLCPKHRRADPAAYVTDKNWRIVTDYARLAGLPIPLRESIMVEFVRVDYLHARRAAIG